MAFCKIKFHKGVEFNFASEIFFIAGFCIEDAIVQTAGK